MENINVSKNEYSIISRNEVKIIIKIQLKIFIVGNNLHTRIII